MVGKTTTDTLTNKTLTSPDINTPDIDGGTIDNTPIGNTTATTAKFTSVSSSLGITVTTGNVSSSLASTGSFGNLRVGGNNFLGSPATLLELNESTDATDDKIILWDESTDLWKYMTLDNLQDSIDTTGGGGGGISFDGSVANGVLTFKDSDEATTETNLTFDGSELIVTGDLSASGTHHTLEGKVSINYGNGASMTGSLSNGEGYGEIVQFGHLNSGVTKGDVVIYRTNSHGWIQADKDTGYQAWSWMGVCIDSNADGSTAITGAKILLKGVVRLGAGHIADAGGDEGDPVYLQDAGHVTFAVPGSGDYARIVGYVIDEAQDIIYLDPSKTWVELS